MKTSSKKAALCKLTVFSRLSQRLLLQINKVNTVETISTYTIEKTISLFNGNYICDFRMNFVDYKKQYLFLRKVKSMTNK